MYRVVGSIINPVTGQTAPVDLEVKTIFRAMARLAAMEKAAEALGWTSFQWLGDPNIEDVPQDQLMRQAGPAIAPTLPGLE